jgi:predicted SnoaL-like aldol condensation-catalyzing enzyme
MVAHHPERRTRVSRIREHLAVSTILAMDVLAAMVAIFASGDPADAAAVVADDYLDHQGLGDGPRHGVAGFAEVVRANRDACEHQEITIEDLFGTADRAVARIRWRGRLRGGAAFDRQTIDIIRVVDGRAAEHWGAEA